MANKKYIWYTHQDSEITNVNQLLESFLGIIQPFNPTTQTGMTARMVMDYAVDGVANRERIIAQYNELDFATNGVVVTSLDGNSSLKTNTRLAIPEENVNKETLAVTGKNQLTEQQDYKTFITAMHKQLLEHPGYRLLNRSVNKSEGGIRLSHPNITVWMWVRALTDEAVSTNPDPSKSPTPSGKFIDISAFIINCDMESAENGGNFSINIAPIPVIGSKSGWIIDRTPTNGTNQVVNTSLHKISDNPRRVGELDRRLFLFHHLVQPNDMIFIRFETLIGEAKQRRQDGDKFNLTPQDIPGKNYDLIGLVDATTMSVNAATNDVDITINGRDLTKAIIDDGSYFYATPAHSLAQLDRSGGLMQRLTANGRYAIMAEYAYRSIAWSMQFMMNVIAGISVVPDEAFVGYGGRRVLKYRIEGSQDKGVSNFEPTFEDEPARGIWQIIRLSIDSSIASRYIADPSIAYPDGSLINQFFKICQSPFVEFSTDTIGDQFWFIVRQPPFTGQHLRSLFTGDLSEPDPDSEPGTTNRGKLPKKKVQKDAQVEDTPYIADNSIEESSGGGLFKQKKEKIKVQELEQVTVSNVSRNTEYILTVEEIDVVADTLSFNNDPCYSIYEIKPSGPAVGANEVFTIHLEEYAQVYGAKRLSVESQYVPYEASSGFNADKDKAYVAEQIAADLVFLIESNMYLPFTRQGTITINGDRRFKKGTWIRYAATGEIFYVNAIAHNYRIGSTIDRTTTLTVERGMVEKYATGGSFVNYEGEFIEMSYFNLVDLELIKNVFTSFLTGGAEDLQENVKYNTELSQKGAVNEKVFTFFQKRRQFMDQKANRS